ncbi:hypothetical protein BJX70DRAFT_361510 [Aspergillus crustosus]
MACYRYHKACLHQAFIPPSWSKITKTTSVFRPRCLAVHGTAALQSIASKVWNMSCSAYVGSSSTLCLLFLLFGTLGFPEQMVVAVCGLLRKVINLFLMEQVK